MATDWWVMRSETDDDSAVKVAADTADEAIALTRQMPDVAFPDEYCIAVRYDQRFPQH